MSTYQVGDQSDSINKIQRGYGGSDTTKPSFNRPRYVKYNTFAKARDLGDVVNIAATITGAIGTEAGANTHYYKVKCLNSSDLKIQLNPSHRYTDKNISVGLLDQNRKSVQLDTSGYGYNNEVVNTEVKEKLLTLPAGEYYFTVNCSQWQSVPYSISIQVIRYLSLEGAVSGTSDLYGRIGLVKMWGTILGEDKTYATLLDPLNLKRLGPSHVGGQNRSYGTLAGLIGATNMNNATNMTLISWRLEGAAGGENASHLTLTVTGGGYP